MSQISRSSENKYRGTFIRVNHLLGTRKSFTQECTLRITIGLMSSKDSRIGSQQGTIGSFLVYVTKIWNITAKGIFVLNLHISPGTLPFTSLSMFRMEIIGIIIS